MNWNDPAARLALIEAVGPDAYSAALKAHQKATTVATVAGHDIRPVASRFGELFLVGSSGRAFSTLDEAKTWAAANPAS